MSSTRLSPSQFVSHLKGQRDYRQQIVCVQDMPARGPRYGNLDRPLPDMLQQALLAAGFPRFYLHQAQAINAIRQHVPVLLTTSAASGKTLAYNVPVLESILIEPRARSLYLFPTKALAQDQLRSLRQLTQHLPHPVTFGTYDGDTGQAARRRLRQSASVLLTNPDMLHMGILPNHSLWSQFLSQLRYIVVDEAHVYRGIFGSQVACVLRRLLRICRFYGSEPQFVLSSATIANPAEHAHRLTSVPVTVISDDGSPQSRRQFVLWNPPFVDADHSARRSANVEATTLFVELARHGLRNITFVRARKVAELILRYARELLAKEDPALVPLITAYRSGYRSELRREIEQELFAGHLIGVTATNALELGVDVGHLDATVMVGYPGTIASTWQQAGRAGRGAREALNILIALDNPLDQYFMQHPEALFGSSVEHALIAPDNVHLLLRHLPCAAYERPLTPDDEELFGPGFVDAMIQLERSQILEYRGERWFYAGGGYPAERTSLRALTADRFAILDESMDYRLLEELEGTLALQRIYPGAIYLHQGESYLIKRLDLDTRIAYAAPVEVDYYTEPRQVSQILITKVWKTATVGRGRATFGELHVTEQVVSFRRMQQFSDTVLSVEPLDLPSSSYYTSGLWFEIPEHARSSVERQGLDFVGGLHALEHACIGMLPLFAMCDRMDIGGLSTPLHSDTGAPTVFLYEGIPGGVGIAEKGFDLLHELWRATWAAIRDCPCASGCPSCIQSPKCGNNNEPLDKAAAIMILESLVGSEAGLT